MNPSPLQNPQAEPTNRYTPLHDAPISEEKSSSTRKSERQTPEVFGNSWDPFSLKFNPEAYSKGKSHFQITFYFVLSSFRRQALKDFHAFCRLADDIADNKGLSDEKRQSLIEKLRNWVRDPQHIGHAFWDRLLKARQELGISDQALLGILDGVAWDIGRSELKFQTWDELNQYVFGVACCVGEGVLQILGAGGPKASAYALSMGRCLQYLNIMRDIEEDLENRRVYVPEEFLNGRPLISLTKEIREEFYTRAMHERALAKPYSWRCLPAELMAGVYIEAAQKYWRFGNIHRLKRSEKIAALVHSLWKWLWS